MALPHFAATMPLMPSWLVAPAVVVLLALCVVSPAPTVLTTGFTGCTSSRGWLGLFLAVGLGLGSGLSSGSSAALGAGLTRRGRLDCAVATPPKKTNATHSDK